MAQEINISTIFLQNFQFQSFQIQSKIHLLIQLTMSLKLWLLLTFKDQPTIYYFYPSNSGRFSVVPKKGRQVSIAVEFVRKGSYFLRNMENNWNQPVKQIILRIQIRQRQYNDCFLKWKHTQLDNKNMKIISRVTFSFSKCYDLVTIGPYANRVAKAVVSHQNSIRALTIEQENHIMEPSLISLGSPRIDLQQRNSTNSDIQMGVGVRDINPDRCFVTLKNGARYFYKNLVYSGNPADWKGFSSANQQARREKSSFIHNDIDYQNIEQLFARRGGSIVFTVPKDMHFGCQNYFMLMLKDKIRKNRAVAPFQTDPLKITVLCEGQSLVPFNQAYNQLLEDYFQASKIKLIKNTDYSIEVKKRQVKINKGKSTINFDSLFEYLPLKVPQVLEEAGIDPFQINRHTLSHSRYENIFILGNVVNNVYSLSAVCQMSKIIAENVVYRTLGIQKRSLYQGYSKINLWLNNQECHQFETDYNGSRLSRDFGQFKIARNFVAQYHTNYLQKITWKTINSGFNIFSMFSQAEAINTERNQVPAFYKAEPMLT